MHVSCCQTRTVPAVSTNRIALKSITAHREEPHFLQMKYRKDVPSLVGIGMQRGNPCGIIQTLEALDTCVVINTRGGRASTGLCVDVGSGVMI